jgi:hypothetical protein
MPCCIRVRVRVTYLGGMQSDVRVRVRVRVTVRVRHQQTLPGGTHLGGKAATKGHTGHHSQNNIIHPNPNPTHTHH